MPNAQYTKNRSLMEVHWCSGYHVSWLSIRPAEDFESCKAVLTQFCILIYLFHFSFFLSASSKEPLCKQKVHVQSCEDYYFALSYKQPFALLFFLLDKYFQK